MQLHLFPADSELSQLQVERARLQTAVLAASTISSYGYDFAMFSEWAGARDRAALPASPETVGLYLTAILVEGRKVATARRRAAAVAYHHRSKGLPSPITPDICQLLAGAQRSRLERPRQMRPLSVAQLRAISEALALRKGALAARDRAIFVVGYCSALRRSNLAALHLGDIEFTPEGFVISVGREKNHQEGGRYIGVPRGKRSATCPVRILRAWLKVRPPGPGPLFCRVCRRYGGKALSGEAVEHVVKRGVALIGLDPRDRWAPHALRAGLVTAAIDAGTSDYVITAQTGHAKPAGLRDYYRRVNLFAANVCYGIGI